jgi:hypothetical protein
LKPNQATAAWPDLKQRLVGYLLLLLLLLCFGWAVFEPELRAFPGAWGLF